MSGISTRQSENMKKLSPNRAQLFLRNKYTVFTMGGPVTEVHTEAHLGPIKNIFCRYNKFPNSLYRIKFVITHFRIRYNEF